MAIVTDIGTLKSEVAAYLYDRTDLTNQIPNFISMAQKRLFRVLQCRENEAQIVGTIGSNAYTVPANYESLRYLLVNDRPLDSITERDLRTRLHNRPAVGAPNAFARIQTQWIFHPTADADYSINLYYYADLSSDVSDDAATNLVLTAFPDLYLWGSLLMAAPFLNEDDRIGTWNALYDNTLNTIRERNSDEEYSGSNLTVSSVY